MLIKNKLAILMTLLGVTIAALSSARESIALADLTAQGVPATSAAIISDRLRNDLFSTGLFTVIERSQMDQILKEQGFQQSGCTSDACAIEVGQLLGVQYIAIGSVGYIGKTYTLNVRMIDVKTGEIIRSASEDCRCEIDELMKKMVPKIAKSMSQVVQTSAQSTPKASSPIPTKPEKSAPIPKPQISTEPDSSILQTKSTSHKKELTANQPKNRFIPRVIIGVLGVSGIGAGVYFNSVIESESKNSKDFYARYTSEQGTVQGEDYFSKFELAESNAKAAATPRLISYIVGGLAAVGFTLTFVF